MTRERWFRSDDDVGAFDWLRSAREIEVPIDVARTLYERALRRETDRRHAETLYLRWLREAKAVRTQVAPLPVPGRQTRAMHEADADGLKRSRDFSRLDPGRRTRVLLENRGEDERSSQIDEVRHAMQSLGASNRDLVEQSATEALRDRLVAAAVSGRGVAEVLAAAQPAAAASVLRGLQTEQLPGRSAPVLRLVAQAADGEVERVLGHGSAGVKLPSELAARLGNHVGVDAVGAARVHSDDTADLIAAAYHARALTVGSDIYFAHGEYAPGTARGDELLAHELTHVAQGQRGELTRAAAKGIDSGGPLDPAEAEADLQARLAVIQLHPPDSPVPDLAAPSGQPTSDADRAAKLAAQQQRIGLADQQTPTIDTSPGPPIVSAAAPVPNPPPAMTVPAAPASLGNAYVETFQAAPSQQALQLWGQAGTKATAQAAADRASFDAALPQMPIVLVGSATPAGEAGNAAGPGQETATGTAPPGALPPDATASPTAQPPAAPPPPPTIPPPTPEATDAQAQAQAQADGRQAIDKLPTTAPDVNTNPGTAPMTELAGQTDPVRTLGDHRQAISDSAKAFDDAKAQIVAGPGAARVQPIQLDDKLTVPADQSPGAMPALPTVNGMAKFKKWNLPAAAQSAFDAQAKPKMDVSLAQAQAQMTQAQTQRDTDRTKAVSDAQDKAKQAHIDADQQQQTKVAESRARIASYQAETLVQHEAEIQKLDAAAGDQKKTTIGKINDRIAADQTKVDSDFKDAQKRADDRRTQGEADAAKKKQDAQEKAANQSWWDQLVGAISDAIQSIANDINQILNDIVTAVDKIIDDVKTAACQVIDAARDFVCQTLTEFGDWLKSAVNTLIGSTFPELAAALDKLIDDEVANAKTAVNAVADGLKQGVTELCDGLKASIDGVIAAFKAAVQAAATLAQAAATGDWDLVAKMVIDGILSALGIDPVAFYALIGKAQDSLEKIVEDPGAFVGHLVDALKLGFHQFGDNFWTHLQDGLVGWLTSTLAPSGIVMPASLDLAGIFDLVCQVFGLTWPRLRVKVVNLIGEQNAERLEFVAGYLQALVTGGFAGLWEKVQQDLSSLWNMVVGGIRDWLITNVVQSALIKLATMWNPIGAIFEMIETAWNAYQWLRQNAQRIFGLVEAVVNSISSIVAGGISGAANFVEASLAKLVPVAISLLADLIGLGGLADQIMLIIKQVETTVDEAIDALIERVMAMFRGEGGKGDNEDSEPEPVMIHFHDKEEAEHELTLSFDGDNPSLTVASKHPTGVQHQIAKRRAAGSLTTYQDNQLEEAWGLHDLLIRMPKPAKDVGNTHPAPSPEVNKKLEELAQHLRDGDAWKSTKVKETQVVFNSLGAKSVVAAPLTKRPGNTVGSKAERDDPSVFPNWQAKVGTQTSGPGGKNPWRRVHLLGDMLHGPGNTELNLVPGQAITNQQLFDIENDAFRRIFDNDEELTYAVTVTLSADPFFPAHPKGIHVVVTSNRPTPGTPVTDKYIDTAEPHVAGVVSFSAAQTKLLTEYENFQTLEGRKPTQRELAKILDITQMSVWKTLTGIRQLIDNAPQPLAQHLQDAETLLNL